MINFAAGKITSSLFTLTSYLKLVFIQALSSYFVEPVKARIAT